MPTGLPLDFDTLLAPLADEPAGSSSVYFELRSQLEELRTEINPDDFDEGDPKRQSQPKRADWQGLEALTRDTLANSSKDLRIAGYLMEALVRRYGFPGLRDGLHLLREMLEQCWDRMYPSIEDGDLDVRAGLFNSLDDMNTRGKTPFPQLVRTLPILGTGTGKHGFYDWKLAQEAGQEELADTVARALQATPAGRGAELSAILADCQREVDALAKTLEEKIGPDTTHLPNVRAAIQDCQRVVRLLEQKDGDDRPADEAESDTPANASSSEPRSAGGGQTRADAYRQLASAAALLQRLEPHSPIPYLVQRAVELGALPFPQLMRALIRDANVLTELNREMGIKSEEGS